MLAALTSFCFIHTSSIAFHSLWEHKSWLDMFLSLVLEKFPYEVGVTLGIRD